MEAGQRLTESQVCHSTWKILRGSQDSMSGICILWADIPMTSTARRSVLPLNI